MDDGVAATGTATFESVDVGYDSTNDRFILTGLYEGTETTYSTSSVIIGDVELGGCVSLTIEPVDDPFIILDAQSGQIRLYAMNGAIEQSDS